MATKATQDSAKQDHVILIDGSGYIFRAYHALPPMTRPDGTPVNAVYGFTSMLLKLVDDSDAEYLAVIFDTARKTFRSDIYKEYKANRPPPPDDLIPQFSLIRDATRAFGLPQAELEGYEADDLIATYARQAADAGQRVTIVSSDKDLMQLVDDNISMMDPMKGTAISYPEVEKRFGVRPDKVIDIQSLAGDSTDNVPGVPGIGVKTAALLIDEYGDLDTLLERAGEIKQTKRRENLIEFADLARVSRELVTLKQDVPVEAAYDSFVLQEPDPDNLIGFLEEQGFKTILARVKAELARDGHLIDDDDGVAEAAADAVTDGGYALIQEEAALAAWIAAAQKQGVVAVDTETNSLDSLRAELVGVSLSVAEPVAGARACYIPLGHVAPRAQGALDLGGDGDNTASDGTPKQIPLKKAVAALKPLLEDRGVLKIAHNAKYDSEVFARQGIHMGPIDDTMLLSYVLEGGAHGHGLDELTLLHTGRTNIKFSEVCGTGKNRIGFAEVALDKALDYAAEDADVTLALHRILKPRLVSEHMATVYETIERPLVDVLEEMETHGIKVDATELKRLSDDFEKRIADLGEEIHELAGHEFNVGSPKQLGEILFDEMGLPGGKKGKTGAYATGADILEGLAAQGHDLPARVLDWRQLSKLKSTYTDALLGQISPETGRVHTSYSQAIASTGRLSSNDPNLQNIPIRTEEGRKIRKAFVAEKGHVLLSADYSQIELRLLAHVADITPLKEAFHEGADIHAATASEVFGIPLDQLDGPTRNRAKAINFGIIYGISPFGLARQLAIPQKDAKTYIEAYFEKYPGVRDYMEEKKEAARADGFVTTIFGRKVHVPGINDKNPARRNFMERAAINAPLQGAAADIIKRAMIRMPRALTRAKLKAKMLLQVHDELIFEVPEAELDKTTEVVTATMEAAAHLSVPLVCETGVGSSWDEAH
ncbi:MAG: DNA polymerase I [Rhodospirillaceae bacterium]|jgi:DNA polymerase I|nr:DNA polymerase I [Rhodospirillaceae bacterium]MBT5458782.1 DNA polymerase I [Rhodospirillaceae bacterium]